VSLWRPCQHRVDRLIDSLTTGTTRAATLEPLRQEI
jgi:hypothetical protein